MKSLLYVLAALACLRSAGVDAAAIDDVRTVGLQGGQIPGEPAGVTFFRLNSPTINSHGEVVFRTLLGGVGANPASDVGTHGVFVFNHVAVPEPATLVFCLALASTICLARGKRLRPRRWG